MDDNLEIEQPLSPAGRLFLQPLMNHVINITIAGEHPISVDSLKIELQNSMLIHPRFCSLMVRDSNGREHWRKTQVDLDRHLIIRRQPLSVDDSSLSDEDAVNDYLADLSFSSPLPTDKPLWEIHILAAHKALVFRVHHALGDGISLMAMFLSACRKVDDPSQPPTIGGVGAAAFVPRRWSVRTVVKMFWFTLIYLFEFVLRSLWLRDTTTAVSGGTGVELWPRRLATAKFQLDDMKTVKRAVAESTINDVLFGVISSGLSRYLDIRSSSSQALPDGLQITGLATVNLRPQTGLQDISKLMNSNCGTRWGNKFGVILFPVCYHKPDSDPLQIMKRSKAMLDKKKLSLEAPLTHKFLDLITFLFGAKFASIINYRVFCNTTFSISNVVGPQEKITFVGSTVKYFRVTSSSLPNAITMHMVSYAGVAEMQILVAKDIIPDPKVLAKCFEDALLEMKEAAEAIINS